MARGAPLIEHILRRGGFGASPSDLTALERYAPLAVVEYLLNYQQQPDEVDSKIGDPAYATIAATNGAFSPDITIDHARQRWLFRMLHSQRPLQEKMALFWHNHFATAYSKLNGFGEIGSVQATKMLALVSGNYPGPQGQLETFRQLGLGRFRDLLLEMARDPAMLVWLDGRTNIAARPQENFGREIMELFTFGLGNYVEQDVYAAARVFTGWNLRFVPAASRLVTDPASYYEFFYNAGAHDTTPKTFTFAIYPDGNKTIPGRSGADGMQDGVDFINALARHPNTAKRLVRKLWNYLVSEETQPDDGFVNQAASIYLSYDTSIAAVVRYIFNSSAFLSQDNWFSHYSWPAEFVTRAVKEVGWSGYSVDTSRTALVNMNQVLFEPPDVAGWELGQGWFSTGTMLARMNFASSLALNQKFNLARAATPVRDSADSVIRYFLDRLSPSSFDDDPAAELKAYMLAGGPWTGVDAQLQTKAAGLIKLIVGSSEYQLV
jgi:uncharacterized protein (DUF1800 family)